MVESVGPLVGVEEVRGVAERHLRHRFGVVDHRVDRGAHLFDVVEGVEDAEDVHPDLRSLRHEGPGHLGRVGGVADGVAAAQQHLQVLVRHRGPQFREALPRVLTEEPQRHVVGGPAPALDGEHPGQQPRLPGSHRHQVAGAHACGEQRLVGVAEGGVGDAHCLLLTQSPGESGRAEG